MDQASLKTALHQYPTLKATLDQYESLGRLNEDADTIDARLHAAVEAIGANQEMYPSDLGSADWAAKTVVRLKSAVHDEICNPSLGRVKQKYQDLQDKGSGKESIVALGSVITGVCVALGLGPLAMESVVLYLAVGSSRSGSTPGASPPALLGIPRVRSGLGVSWIRN
jgi:hypothetical protein